MIRLLFIGYDLLTKLNMHGHFLKKKKKNYILNHK